MNTLTASDIENLYTKINEKVKNYIFENESSLSENESVNEIFHMIAKNEIKNKLIEIDARFESMKKEEQQKSIQFNLKRIEKTMIEEMKQKGA